MSSLFFFVSLSPMRRLAIILLTIATTLAVYADNLGYSKFNPLVIGLDLDYAPMQYVDEEGLPKGLDVELTQTLMQRLNVPYTYRPNTWEAISGDVLKGRVDLAMMVYSPYRQSLINYSRAVFKLYYQVVYRNDREDADEFNMRQIKDKKIAYMSSRPITDTLTKAGAVLHVVRDLPKALQDLSAGEYDAVICFRYQAKYHINRLHLSNLTAEDLTLTPREYCYVSHNRKLIDAIDRELLKMDKDGTIDDIYGDYISQLDEFHLPQWVWWLVGGVICLTLLLLLWMQRRHNRRLHIEMRRAQKSEHLKTVFLANVSHALRTPLNAVIGFSEMLYQNEDAIPAEDRRQMYNQINKNGNQLLYFINELLELSNIEGGGLEFTRVATDIGEQLESYKRELESRLQNDVVLKIESPHRQCVAEIDVGMLRHVMMHLLSNAIRHTSQGSITMEYRQQDYGLYFAVTDTGEGIPEYLKENIFALLSDKNTFVQQETPGLGLSICKSILDSVHGRVGMSSEVGKGSTFWFWTPCKIITIQ